VADQARKSAKEQTLTLLSLASKCTVGLLVAFAGLPPAVEADGSAAYQDLYDFGANYGGYRSPFPLVMAEGPDGNLYGVLPTGGTHDKGTLFRIGAAGGLTTVYNFDGAHGSTPVGGLTLGPDGNLYGMAEHGSAHGYGDIFRITPSGAFSVLYEFQGGADGGYPVSPLIVGADGSFYGTSYPGVAFRVTPHGDFSVLAKIPTISNGALVQAEDGSFYGVTEFGGKYGAGTIYRIDGSSCTVLHSFDGAGGSYPVGGLAEGADGNFYGTTTAGGRRNAGVIYRVTPAGAFSVVVHFEVGRGGGGYQSYGGLVAGADGELYGVTIWGGTNGDGVIFAVTTSGAYSVLYNLDAPQGTGAYGTPVQDTNGSLYGMTNRGGGAKNGVVYRFSDGSPSFLRLTVGSGTVGQRVGVLGDHFLNTSSVEFNGTPASFNVRSDNYLVTQVPSGETGFVRVDTSQGDLTSNTWFRVAPQITAFSPPGGKAGDTVTVTGTGLVQATGVTVGGVAATQFIVRSDSIVAFIIPVGARTGKITVTTPGGTVTSRSAFAVHQ
jgi:uncharacterized repeat protein (TIGR03803 family)